MYKIGKYQFEGFKYRLGHRANYAVLPKPGDRELGIKYSPAYGYSNEYDVLDNFSHPQIPKCYDFGREEFFEKEKFIFIEHYIVLQHYKGEDIIEYYKKKRLLSKDLKINQIVKHFSSATEPLQYLHSNGYVHADIKPGHLILNPYTGIVGLIDLELTIKTGELIKGVTIEYASPEQKQMSNLLKNVTDAKGEKAVLKQVKIDGRTDLYTIGLILYEVLTGKMRAETTQQPIEINNAIPQKLNEIILGLLEEDPSNRIPSAEKLKDELASVA